MPTWLLVTELKSFERKLQALMHSLGHFPSTGLVKSSNCLVFSYLLTSNPLRVVSNLFSLPS